ncbi:coiled-coil domain-containing protein [Wolbachia pipientis]|uniref:hypothetical protein n=1 Tax=Wolbachia pipientis TaxID=955 RepID=UPI0020309793|nr:hypothetical protein [Wolbachia pipientis]MCM1001674.1 hypothetical protein [Wolbachia pipientis]
MSNLFKKANLPYLVVSSLATLTLISSLVLAVTSQIPFPLILALATLSVLVIALLCKAISSNKRMEVERSKFAEKEQRLENKMSLEKEAGEAANKKIGELRNQLNESTKENQGLDKRARGLNEEVIRLEAEKDNLSEEKESLGQKLEDKTNRIAELCRMVNEFEKIINAPYKQEKKSHREQQVKELRCRQMKELRYVQMKKSLRLKISRLYKQLREEESNLAKKKECIAKLKREMNIIYGEPKNRELDKEKEELQAELDRLKSENKWFSQENSCVKKELEKVKQDADVDAEEVDNAYRASCSKQTEIQNLRAILHQQSKSIEDLESELDQQKKENEQLVQECQNECKRQREVYVKQLQELECIKDAEIKRLNDTLHSPERTKQKQINQQNSVSQKPKSAMRARSFSLTLELENAINDPSFLRRR